MILTTGQAFQPSLAVIGNTSLLLLVDSQIGVQSPSSQEETLRLDNLLIKNLNLQTAATILRYRQ